MVRKNKFFLLLSILSFSVYLLLFIFQGSDDNRLTSWEWAFPYADPALIFMALAAAIIFSYFASSVTLPPESYSYSLFLLSFLVSSIFWREPELIVDASRYFTQAKCLELYGIKYFFIEWGRAIPAWTDLPAIPFLYGLIFRFFGESRIFIQIFTSSLFSLSVVFTCLIGKKLRDEETGFFAGLFLLGIPYLLTQIPLMLVDVPVMFFLTLSVFAFILALEKGGFPAILIASISIFLTFFSKYSAWLMLSVLPVVSVIYMIQGDSHNRRQYLFRTLMVLLGSAMLIGLFIALKSDVMSEQVNLLISYQKPGLKRWGESFISTFFFQIHPFITIAALYSCYSAIRKRDPKHIIISWLVVLVIVMQIRRIRYIIMVFPMLALMASYGLQEINNCRVKRFIALCSVTSSLVIALFVYLPFAGKMSSVNLKNAGKYLDTIDESYAEVITLNPEDNAINQAVSVPLLDFFTDKPLFYPQETNLPPKEEIRELPLRFTWEFRTPGYYKNALSGKHAMVLISNEAGEELPKEIIKRLSGYRRVRTFTESEGLFKYQTIVTVYRSEDR